LGAPNDNSKLIVKKKNEKRNHNR